MIFEYPDVVGGFRCLAEVGDCLAVGAETRAPLRSCHVDYFLRRAGIDIESSDNFARSEEHTSELQSHSFISYAVFCLKKKKLCDVEDSELEAITTWGRLGLRVHA